MNEYGAVNSNDYTVQVSDVSAPISWHLVSSSLGIDVVEPSGVSGAVQIFRASHNSASVGINAALDTSEYLLYRSIKHIFYTDNIFINGGITTPVSLTPLPSHSFVISIGQSFYGDRVKPGSFALELEGVSDIVTDDGYGNLLVSSSYIGNIFYNQGVAVIKQDTGSIIPVVGPDGMQIVSNTDIFVDYDSEVKSYRHEINIKLPPSQFNYSILNPSLRTAYASADAQFSQSMQDNNIPSSGSNNWKLYDLMGSGIIKPYVTTIGLYNDKYELLAVAKVSTPIQRTFDVNQLFIVRFDV
jgi:hypothetical protein